MPLVLRTDKVKWIIKRLLWKRKMFDDSKLSAALAEDPGSGSTTHTGLLTASYNSISKESDTFFLHLQAPGCI